MSKWIRQFHRWMAVAFTAGFIVNTIVIALGRENNQPYLLVLIPLFLLLPTGLYMFVQPYAERWRRRGVGG